MCDRSTPAMWGRPPPAMAPLRDELYRTKSQTYTACMLTLLLALCANELLIGCTLGHIHRMHLETRVEAVGYQDSHLRVCVAARPSSVPMQTFWS